MNPECVPVSNVNIAFNINGSGTTLISAKIIIPGLKMFGGNITSLPNLNKASASE